MEKVENMEKSKICDKIWRNMEKASKSKHAVRRE